MSYLSGPAHEEKWNDDHDAGERQPENHVRSPEHVQVAWGTKDRTHNLVLLVASGR